MHNLLGQLGSAKLVAFKILNTAGTPTVSEVSNNDFSGDFAITDDGDGAYTVAISNFKSPRGVAFAFATSMTISCMASVTSISYSGSTLTIVIKNEADDSTATDSSMQVLAIAV